MFKRISILFLIGIALFGTCTYASDTTELYTINFSIEGGELLNEDIELIVQYNDNTCTSILLKKEKNYSMKSKLPKGEAKVKILNLSEAAFDIAYDKEFTIDKDKDYIITIKEQVKKKVVSEETTEFKETIKDPKEETDKVKVKETTKPETKVDFSNNFSNILNTILTTLIAFIIVGIIFFVIRFFKGEK